MQGAFRPHLDLLRSLGAEAREVRHVSDLGGLQAVVLPGGESTTMRLLGEERGLFAALRSGMEAGLPVLGTCAGAILLATRVRDGHPVATGVLDIEVERNGFGRQRESFVSVGLGGARKRVFIRAPRIRQVGTAVEVLDRLEESGEVVAVGCGNLLAATYHPELVGDPWLHRRLLDLVGTGRGGDPSRSG